MAVDLSAMRKLYQEGALASAIVAPALLESEAWVLIVVRKDGSKEYMTIARSTRQKIYRSLESVRADVERIGFAEVKLQVA